MYLSNSERVWKVIFNLTISPFLAPKYIANLVSRKDPIELQLPWWSYDSISYIQKSRFDKCFEWGSGGSTLFLAKICKSLKTIENDLDWYNKLNAEFQRKEFDNVSLRHEEIELSDPDSFLRSAYLNSLNEKYDLITIDGQDDFGPESTWSARELCFERAQAFIKPEGMIIVDDSWRYPEIEKKSKAKKILRFESVGPSRKGVTRTDIHHY